MNTLILYYSYTGNTKRLAEKLAGERGAKLAEIVTPKKVSPLKAFFFGCPDSMRGRGWSIDIKGTNLDNYENIVIMGPVWAGNYAPPVIGALELLPPGKNVSLISVSAGTGGSFEKAENILKSKNCNIVETTAYILKGKSIKGK